MSSAVAPESGIDRRKGTRDAIDRFVRQRTDMLAQYWRLAGLKPFSQEDDTQKGSLDEFCQILVDYIAGGHFVLYERIEQGKERRRKVADLAHRLYPRILDLTNVAIDFNDKYASESRSRDNLDRDLSFLGEALASRIDLEDQLINELVSRSA